MSAHAIGRRPALEERRRLVAESLRVSNPGNNARDLPAQADPRHDCQIKLAVEEIKAYEHNPRRASNAKFDEIKESIRACGIRNPITVTRRPGEQHFIIEAGGNTRLLAIQELWAETKDPRFQNITVMYRPWRSESHVLVAHIAENDQRDDLTYWDKATGIMALKGELETELSRPLPLRQFEEELKRLGLTISRSSLSRFQFATEKLGALGASRAWMTGLDIKMVQPRLNLIKRYAENRAGLTESDLYAQVLNPVFERIAYQYAECRTFNSVALCEECELALAEYLAEAVAVVRMQLGDLEKATDSSSEGLNPRVGVQLAPPTRPPKTDVSAAGATAESLIPRKSAQPAAESPEESPLAQSTTPRTNSEEDSGGANSRLGTDGAGSRRDSERSGMAERLKQSVISFARLSDVADCLHFTSVAVCDYYMEAPQTPLHLEPDRPLRRWAWWLLALLSGQMREDLTRELPETSRWRHLFLSEGEEADRLPLVVQDELAGPVSMDMVFIDWLTDPRDDAATLLCEILTSVRSMREAMLQRSSPPDDGKQPGTSR